MAMPTYEDIMLPFLRYLSDGQIHTLEDLRATLSAGCNMNEEEKKRMLPSGRQNMFYNRLGWARTYLKKAYLIDSVARGQFKITQRGLDLLASFNGKIDKNVLMKYPEFLEFSQSMMI